MSWEKLKARFQPPPHNVTGSFVLPSMVLEIEPEFVAAAKLEGSPRRVRRVGVRQLEAGSLVPLPNRSNIVKGEAVRQAVNEVASLVGNGGGRTGLLLPDAAVRVSILRFETLPEKRAEAEAIVRWKMRDVLPYDPEEARVSYQILDREPSALELLAMAVRNSVLAEYEAAMQAANGGPSLVLPAAAALLPLLPESSSQLLAHVCSGSVTTVALAGSRMRFWRNRLLDGAALEAQFEEVARELARGLATCRDHLEMEVEHVWLSARPPGSIDLAGKLSHTLGREVRDLAGGSSHASLVSSGEQELFNRFGTPFAGLVANAGKEG
jgi:hypothetical protein